MAVNRNRSLGPEGYKSPERQPIARRQADQLFALAVETGVCTDEERVDLLLGQGFKHGIELAFVAC